MYTYVYLSFLFTIKRASFTHSLASCFFIYRFRGLYVFIKESVLILLHRYIFFICMNVFFLILSTFLLRFWSFLLICSSSLCIIHYKHQPFVIQIADLFPQFFLLQFLKLLSPLILSLFSLTAVSLFILVSVCHGSNLLKHLVIPNSFIFKNKTLKLNRSSGLLAWQILHHTDWLSTRLFGWETHCQYLQDFSFG